MTLCQVAGRQPRIDGGTSCRRMAAVSSGLDGAKMSAKRHAPEGISRHFKAAPSVRPASADTFAPMPDYSADACTANLQEPAEIRN